MVDIFGFGGSDSEEEKVDLLDLTEVNELAVGESVFLNLSQGATARFNFDVNRSDSMILLKV